MYLIPSPLAHQNRQPILTNPRHEIIQNLLIHRGDDRIAQPNFEWRRGRLYIRVNSSHLVLTWRMMSEAIYGIRQLGWDMGFWVADFTILDDDAGVVGSGNLGLGYESEER